MLLPLAPYVAYQFRVSAVNEVGRSQPSPPSERHETPPAGRRLPRRFPRGGVLSHKEKSTKVARACWGFRGSPVQRGRATHAPQLREASGRAWDTPDGQCPAETGCTASSKLKFSRERVESSASCDRAWDPSRAPREISRVSATVDFTHLVYFLHLDLYLNSKDTFLLLKSQEEQS